MMNLRESRHNGMPPELNGHHGAEQVYHAGALEMRVPFEIACRFEKDLLHHFRLRAEFLVHGKKRGDCTGDVRGSHAGAALFLVRVGPGEIDGAGDDLLAGSDKI